MLHRHIVQPTTSAVTIVRNDLGDLVGAVMSVDVPGSPLHMLMPIQHFVGWAHDWDAEEDGLNQDAYMPVCLGVSDDPETLFAEIERRAREATS